MSPTLAVSPLSPERACASSSSRTRRLPARPRPPFTAFDRQLLERQAAVRRVGSDELGVDRLERESEALEALAQHAVRGARLLVRLGPSIYERPHRFVTVEIRHGHLELVGRGLAPDPRHP